MHKIINVALIVGLCFIFSWVVVGKDVSEERSQISQDEIIEVLRSGEPIRDVSFQGEDLISAVLAIRKEDIEPAICVRNSHIKGDLELGRLAVPHQVTFEEADRWNIPAGESVLRIPNYIDIRYSLIDSVCVLRFANETEKRIIFEHKVNFLGSEFSSGVHFENTIFRSDADFSEATFSELTEFRENIFNGEAVFSGATFSGYAYFWGATFNEDAVFSEVTFSQDAFFMEVNFNNDADFKEANFSKLTDFRQVTFSKLTDFEETAFNGYASFSGSTFSGDADFWNATFSGETGFSDVTFSEKADFRWASFEGKTAFSGATFSWFANFEKAIFKEGVCFRFATSDKGINFHNTSFGDYLEDSSIAFSVASRGWGKVGNRERADYYFYRHMVTKRMQKSWFDPRRWLEWLFIDLTCAYGTSSQRVLGTWGTIILICSFIFWLGSGIVRCEDQQPIRSFWQSLYFSILTFVTLGPREYEPRLREYHSKINPSNCEHWKIYDPRRYLCKTHHWTKVIWKWIKEIQWFRVVVSFESLIGAFTMALFVLVFARKFMR